MDELYHHGIKGQRWGVRRFQNPDGTLTAAGKRRRSKSIDVNSMDRKDFLKLLDSGRDFIVSKGSEAYRSTTHSKETLLGKKYVSLRADDISTYEGFVRETYDSDDVYNITYSTNKKMKVAGAREQAKILQKMYGKNFNMFKTYEELVKKGLLDKNKLSKPISRMTDDEFGDYMYYNPFGHNMDILNRPTSDPNTKKFIDALSKKKYDAVVDMADWSIRYADGPFVILKSEDTLKEKSYTKVE